MKASCFGILVVAILAATADVHVVAGDAKEQAIKKDRKSIEGTWKILTLEINGNKPVNDEDIKKIIVVNHADGAWSIRIDGKEMLKGTSQIDPTKKLRTIDFTPTEGDSKDKLHLGIYELGKNTRKLCFAEPGKDRPTEFSSQPGSGHILVTFERATQK